MNEPRPEPQSPIFPPAIIMTAPLVPPEVDLRNFDFVPIFRRRLLASKFHRLASPAEWRAGFLLWLKSWDEVPAGSLPNDDRELWRLAECRDNLEWRKLKKWALHGWIVCDDGRLYHPVVAEVTTHAWERIEANRHRTSAATAARMRHRDEERNVDFSAATTPHHTEKKPRASARKASQNGEDKGSRGTVRAIDPKILGHGDFCQCANCQRWAAAQAAKTKQGDDAR